MDVILEMEISFWDRWRIYLCEIGTRIHINSLLSSFVIIYASMHANHDQSNTYELKG